MAEPFPPLERPVVVPAGSTSMVLARLDQAAGRAAAEHAVTSGVLRPFDIATAEVVEPRPLWIPFWRVTLEVPVLGGSAVGAAERPRIHVMIPARRAFPYAPRIPSAATRLSGTILDPAPDALVPADADVLLGNGATVVDADVDREDASITARELFLKSVAPGLALPARFAPEIAAAELVLYPVYHATYTYRGEARRDATDGDFFVAVSGETGDLVAATYPSVVRSLAAKLRRALSFDRRV